MGGRRALLVAAVVSLIRAAGAPANGASSRLQMRLDRAGVGPRAPPGTGSVRETAVSQQDGAEWAARAGQPERDRCLMNPSRKPLIAGNWRCSRRRLRGDTRGGVREDCARDARGRARHRSSVYGRSRHAQPSATRVRLVWRRRTSTRRTRGYAPARSARCAIEDAGCTWVIVGHSERRHILAETDELVAEKVAAALEAGLMPIVCVGETLAQRDAGQTFRVVRLQIDAVSPVLAGASIPVAIAYEPIWAIGTGKCDRRECGGGPSAIREWLGERDAKLAGVAAPLRRLGEARQRRVTPRSCERPTAR